MDELESRFRIERVLPANNVWRITDGYYDVHVTADPKNGSPEFIVPASRQWGAECVDEIQRHVGFLAATDGDEAGDDRQTLLQRIIIRSGSPMPDLVSFADIEPRLVRWIWQRKIAAGRISLVVGDPGVGKSFLTLYMLSLISNGGTWPDGSPCKAGSSILISNEDDPNETIVQRLIAAAANLEKVRLLRGMLHADSNGNIVERSFTLNDLQVLEEALKRCPDCQMVVIDPIGSYLGGKVDAHRDNEIRGVLAPLARLAEKYGPAIVLVAHRKKGGGRIADEMTLGSRAFTGIARAVWHVEKDPADKRLRRLLAGKNNLAPEQSGLAFSIVGGETDAHVQWEDGAVLMNADEGIAEAATIDIAKPGRRPESRQHAMKWLESLLANGAMRVKAIKAAAEAAGQAWRTVNRAADGLGMLRRPPVPGADCEWYWELPPCQNHVPDAAKHNHSGIVATPENIERESAFPREMPISISVPVDVVREHRNGQPRISKEAS